MAVKVNLCHPKFTVFIVCLQPFCLFYFSFKAEFSGKLMILRKLKLHSVIKCSYSYEKKGGKYTEYVPCRHFSGISIRFQIPMCL